jgi:histidine triad (HIT) family protein
VSVQSEPTDCIFCKIVDGEIPATLVAENPFAVAFRDLNPVAPVHVLVVPRDHITDASDINGPHGDLLVHMFQLANTVAALEDIASSGYRLVLNVGDDAGNTVPHLHLHVIGGRQMAWPPG